MVGWVGGGPAVLCATRGQAEAGWVSRRPSNPACLTQIDTPRQRAQLATALARLRDQHRITRLQAAAAILDLDSRSTRFIAASLLEAVALSVGVTRTAGGLKIAAAIAA